MPRDISVMLVEPDTNVQAKICQMLADEFDINQTVVMQSSQEAMGLISSNKHVDCMIINSHLLDSSGFTLVKDIKRIEKFSTLSILIISESNDREHLLNAAACGASDYIVKPINKRSFVVKMKKLIGGKHFRKDQRITTFEAFDTEINFETHGAYQAKLVDISAGGCSVKSEIFSHGGCIYDMAVVKIGETGEQFALRAELSRTERDPEISDEPPSEMLAAFEFIDLSDEDRKKLKNFINQFQLSQNQ